MHAHQQHIERKGCRPSVCSLCCPVRTHPLRHVGAQGPADIGGSSWWGLDCGIALRHGENPNMKWLGCKAHLNVTHTIALAGSCNVGLAVFSIHSAGFLLELVDGVQVQPVGAGLGVEFGHAICAVHIFRLHLRVRQEQSICNSCLGCIGHQGHSLGTV